MTSTNSAVERIIAENENIKRTMQRELVRTSARGDIIDCCHAFVAAEPRLYRDASDQERLRHAQAQQQELLRQLNSVRGLVKAQEAANDLAASYERLLAYYKYVLDDVSQLNGQLAAADHRLADLSNRYLIEKAKTRKEKKRLRRDNRRLYNDNVTLCAEISHLKQLLDNAVGRADEAQRDADALLAVSTGVFNERQNLAAENQALTLQLQQHAAAAVAAPAPPAAVDELIGSFMNLVLRGRAQ